MLDQGRAHTPESRFAATVALSLPPFPFSFSPTPGSVDCGGPSSSASQPTDKNVEAYIREFRTFHVAALVRACECSYSTDRITAAGIKVHDMAFPDGDPPPEDVINRWLDLCDLTFAKASGAPAAGAAGAAAAGGGGGGGGGATPTGGAAEKSDKPAIAVHCVAGLGRAPVLVCIALIESGLEPLEAVNVVREKRSNALNRRQLLYLTDVYKRRRGKKCCIL